LLFAGDAEQARRNVGLLIPTEGGRRAMALSLSSPRSMRVTQHGWVSAPSVPSVPVPGRLMELLSARANEAAAALN
jgi:hypothetical protein